MTAVTPVVLRVSPQEFIEIFGIERFDDGSGYTSRLSVSSGRFSCLGHPFCFDDLKGFTNSITRACERVEGKARLGHGYEKDFLEIEVLSGEKARPAIPALLRMVESSNGWQRVAAFRALPTAGAIDLSLVLLAGMTNANPAARSNAVAALSSLAEPVRAAAAVLVAALSDPDPWARSETARTLAEWETDLALRLVLTLPYVESKAQAGTAYSIGRLAQRPELSVPVLTDCLINANSSVREAAATALGRFGSDAVPAVPGLKELLNDPKRGVREAVTNALSEITLNGVTKPSE